MARRKPRSAHHIYNHARGQGWILTAYGDMEQIERGHEMEVVLYYTDEERVETHTVRNTKHSHGVDTLLTQSLDVGGKLAPYEGAKPKPNVPFEDQPRAVRMQRHATNIYAALGTARGMSERVAVAAAEEFGSTWAEKDRDDWSSRVDGVGDGRADRIVSEAEKAGLR